MNGRAVLNSGFARLRVLLIVLLLVALTRPSPAEESQGDSSQFPRHLQVEHLPKAIQLHPQVISGGLPEGDRAFKELHALGVKTIISVDAASPDVERAEQFGLKYVHLPHGYDGIPEQRMWELAKAVTELPGPIYVHCHHGRHRSPAAAAVACVAAGLLPAEQASQVLQLAGTATKYRGLHASVHQARKLSKNALDAFSVDYPSRAKVPPMAEAMVQVGHAFAELKRLEEAGWKAPPDHPDLDPAHQALLLREAFQELLRTEELKQKKAAFQRLMRQSRQSALTLEKLLDQNSASSPTNWNKPASAALRQIEQQCSQCHRNHRDNLDAEYRD